MKKLISFFGSFLIGLINVLVGAGAGIIAVMLFKNQGLSQKQAQANALAVILPVTLISLIIYFLNGYVNFYDNIFLFPAGFAGAFAGTFLLKRISPENARRLLGAFSVFAGLRLLTG